MFSNSAGFTLVEFLVAIVIMLVGLLGLLQTVNTSLSHNLANQLRNEAVAVADRQMSLELAKGFDQVDTTPMSTFVQRPILTGFRNFSVIRTGTAMTNSKQVNIEVRWKYKGSAYSHQVYGGISKTNK
ncbi:MAG TPA: prepilin-type N-terminal cleavage/methylation domain-containing protein [Desulfuromonadaceae bacterium]